jgi:tRNA-binding EMAP/Myf-like protein
MKGAIATETKHQRITGIKNVFTEEKFLQKTVVGVFALLSNPCIFVKLICNLFLW